MVFNVTFNNNSVISWQSVLLMEETTVLPFIIINTKCPKNINFQKLSCFFTGTAQEFKKKFETPILRGRDASSTDTEHKKGQERLQEVKKKSKIDYKR